LDVPAAALEAAAEGRLLYLAEHLAELHASPDLPWLAGRFEFLGEKALGASLTALAMADERGAFRAAASASPRPALARDLWATLDLDELAANPTAAEAFTLAERGARPLAVAVKDVFPSAGPPPGAEHAIIAPLLFNRELLGVGFFVVASDELTEAIARVLATHTAVAIHQLRQREDARRLHSVDQRLWVPDEHFLLAQLRREVNRARRYDREVGLALLRLDNEADIRAGFGAFFTDHLLRRIGSQLLACVRDSDVLGALDGGYAVIHSETPLAGTQLSAERLRDAVIGMVALRFPEVPALEITVRVAGFPATATTAEELVEELTGRPAKEAAA
jgi:diguanylate cyclase (GGDEF)-like protein